MYTKKVLHDYWKKVHLKEYTNNAKTLNKFIDISTSIEQVLTACGSRLAFLHRLFFCQCIQMLMSLVQRRNGALVKLISVHHFHKCVHVREKSSSWRPKNVVWKCICCICAVQVRVLYSLPRLHAPYLLPTKVSFERL